MKRLLLVLAIILTGCGTQGVEGAFGGTISITKVEGYDVICAIAMYGGEVKSIDCIPNASELKEANP